MAVRTLLAVVAASLLISAAHADPVLEDNDLSAELVIDGLAVPTTLAFLGPNDFFVLEKNDGHVVRVTNGVPDTVLDLDVNGCDERGLLGIALHPDFATASPKYVYLYYTESSEGDDEQDCVSFADNKLVRFTWNGAALVDPLDLHDFPSFVSYHNGGPLAFGPDGKLYGVNGDGEQDGPAQNNAAVSTFDDTGVIFRLNDDGSIPTDNPFYDGADADALEGRYFAYGIRNSFGLAFDPISDALWDTENGPGANDEVNRVVAGANSGWRDIMGPGMAPAGLVNLPDSTYIAPAYSIQDPVAVTGLAFASDATTLGASYVGDLFVADFNLGNVYQFEINMARDGVAAGDTHANNQNELDGFLFASGFDGVTDLKEGPDGDLYAVDIGAGEVWRITGANGMATHDLAFTGLKPPKAVAFKPGPPAAKPLKLTLENRGTTTETIENQAQLDDLIDVTFASLGSMTCDPPAATLLPPKKGLPFEWAPGKKLALGLQLTWNDCFNDPERTTKTEDNDDFTLEATVNLGALGEMDADTANDVCPRAPSGDDKGCGKTTEPFRIDLYLK